MRNDPYTERVAELMNGLMVFCHTNYSQASAKLIRNGKPMTRQGLWKMVQGGSLKVATLLEVLDAYGVELQFVKDGQPINVKRGVGPRVKRVVKGKSYDTSKCSALANSFYADGVNEYHDHQAEELYVELETDTSLLVHYCDEELAKLGEGKKFPWMEIISSEERAEFVKKYGTL